MSAPGAGKTSLLEAAVPVMAGVRVGVLEGDVQGSMDADWIAALHVPVVQLNTESGFGGESTWTRTWSVRRSTTCRWPTSTCW